jgi:MATE family multidrug resistance protein
MTTQTATTPGGFRQMLAISLPMVASHACETVLIFTDRLFLSRLGTVPMNAAMAGGLSSYMLMCFFVGLLGYVTALSAQYLGAGRSEICSRITSQALFLSLLGAPLLLCARPLVHGLFHWTAIPAEQLAAQTVYFDILIYAALPVFLRTSLSSFFSGIGRTRVVMIAALVTMGVNILVNYCLIFGHFGFPALGLEGAAYGTIISCCCGLLILINRYFSREIRQAYAVVSSFRLDAQLMKKLLRFGSPAGLEMFLNMLAFSLLIMIFHADGPITATAITIVFNWDMVSFVPLLGIQIGVVSLVGRYMGAGQPEIAAKATISALKMGLVYSAGILILFVSIPELLVAVFEPTGFNSTFVAATPLAVRMLRLAAFYVLSDALMVVFSGALRGAGDTFWTMCVSVCLHWLLIPVLVLNLRILKLPPTTAWSVMICCFMCFSLIFSLRYRSGRWRQLKLTGNGNPSA